MIDLLLDSASTYSGEIDGLILLIGVIVGFWFVLAELVFFGLIFKFRAKKGVKAQYIAGETKKEKRWVTIPHLLVLACDVVIIVAAIRVWMDVKQTLPKPDLTVRVIGQQWAWTFVHPGPDHKLDTDDDITMIDELHIEKGLVYNYELTAKDVIHSFSVPVFRLKQDGVPGRTIHGWFEATKTGEYDIQCAEICGIGHGMMGARLFIESAEEHAAWLKHPTTQYTLPPKVANTHPSSPGPSGNPAATN